jgi:hypothetical protein
MTPHLRLVEPFAHPRAALDDGDIRVEIYH